MFSSLWHKWFGGTSSKPAHARRCIKPRLEVLEDRLAFFAGSLNPTFGVGGMVLTDFGQTNQTAFASALQSDGKIVVVGSSDHADTGSDFVLVRYNRNGTLDNSFGVGGVVTTDFGNTDDTAMAVAIMDHGKIVVAGFSYRPVTGADFVVARYGPDGKLDSTFGKGGKVISDLGSPYDWAESVVVQADGKIVVGGITSRPDTFNDFVLVRYTRDGFLDRNFGPGGKVVTDFGTYDMLYDLAIQPDGKIIAAGQSYIVGVGQVMAVARYTTTGKLDETFGKKGKARVDFGDFDASGTGVTLQADGKIIVYGYSEQDATDDDFALARLNSDGSLDKTFGNAGRALADFGFGWDICYSVAVQPDGKIVAAGFTGQPDEGRNFAVVRFKANGTIDTKFGINGKVITDLGGDDIPRGVLIQPDGSIVVVGYSSQEATGNDFALVRYTGDFVPRRNH